MNTYILMCMQTIDTNAYVLNLLCNVELCSVCLWLRSGLGSLTCGPVGVWGLGEAAHLRVNQPSSHTLGRESTSMLAATTCTVYTEPQ